MIKCGPPARLQSVSSGYEVGGGENLTGLSFEVQSLKFKFSISAGGRVEKGLLSSAKGQGLFEALLPFSI